MADSSILGQLMWYELLTTDMKAAEQFYTCVTEWGVVPFEGAADPYDMFSTGEVPVAGVMTIPQGMDLPPHWGLYVGVPRLEEAVSRVEGLGGSALSEVIEVPTVGRMRTMTDPQGAMFAIYEPANNPQPEAEAPIGSVSWHELYTTDSAAAMTFYTTLFGWRAIEAEDMGPTGIYRMFARTFPLGGMMNKPPEMAQRPSYWGLYFRVDDVDEGAERVKANGGQVLNGPMDVPGGDRIVNCMDPQGAVFSLHQRK